jgi:hypothetical protein
MSMLNRLADRVLATIVPTTSARAGVCECNGSVCVDRNCRTVNGCRVCDVYCCNGCDMTYRSVRKSC